MQKKNNFDFLRLLLSSAVIITHAYPLSGLPDCDALCSFTNGQLSFAYLSVRGFFVISGYLIFQSFDRSHLVSDYYWKRLLRLFPALLIVLVVTVLLAPFVYVGPTFYLFHKSVWTYIPNNISLYRIQYDIDGVFTHNPYPLVINGSLWTITYEFTMYIMISVLFIVKNSRRKIIALLLLFFLLFLVGNFFFIDQAGKFKIFTFEGGPFLDLGIYFIIGSLLAVCKIETIPYKDAVALAIGLLFISSLYFDFFSHIKLMVLPLLVIVFGSMSTPGINTIGNRIGDLSYGIYIYGFPVQQTLMYYFKLNYLELMLYGGIISYGCAFLSWHLVEKKTLKLKALQPQKFFFKQKKPD